MDKKVFEGKDLQEALHLAAESLGIPEPDLDYEIIEQGRRGLFGIGAKSVLIRVMPPISPLEPQAAELLGVGPAPDRGGRNRRRGRRSGGDREATAGNANEQRPRREKRDKRVKSGRAARAPRPEEPPRPPASEEDIRGVESKLQEIIALMGLDLTVEASGVGSGIQMELSGSDEELLEDRDTELLSSLQFVLNRMARRAWPDIGRIRLGDNGKSQGRDGEVIALVREVAQQVSQTGQPKQLHPMNAYERRLVHLTIRKTDGLGSRSEGDGPLKKVNIFQQDKKPGRSGRTRSRRGRGRSGRGGRRGGRGRPDDRVESEGPDRSADRDRQSEPTGGEPTGGEQSGQD